MSYKGFNALKDILGDLKITDEEIRDTYAYREIMGDNESDASDNARKLAKLMGRHERQLFYALAITGAANAIDFEKAVRRAQGAQQTATGAVALSLAQPHPPIVPPWLIPSAGSDEAGIDAVYTVSAPADTGPSAPTYTRGEPVKLASGVVAAAARGDDALGMVIGTIGNKVQIGVPGYIFEGLPVPSAAVQGDVLYIAVAGGALALLTDLTDGAAKPIARVLSAPDENHKARVLVIDRPSFTYDAP